MQTVTWIEDTANFELVEMGFEKHFFVHGTLG